MSPIRLAMRLPALATSLVLALNAHAQSITTLGIPADDSAITPEEPDGVISRGLHIKSQGRQTADALLRNARSGGISGAPISNGSSRSNAASTGGDASTIQVNDPALDHTVSFPGITRPFEFSTQSETTIATHGRHIVVGYNTTAFQTIQLFPLGLFYTQRYLTGYSVSHDAGRTWQSSFTPPAPGSNFTFGDPVVAADRGGHFYFASLGADAAGNTVINVNKSTDNGSTFGTATSVATDNGGDKDWIAVGPDPTNRRRDNVYVTWTSFNDAGTAAALVFARSTDGGATWTSKPIFAPAGDAINSSFVSLSNPVVDRSNGRLYIPFLHFSNIDADNIRVLVSDDGGVTFSFLAFNVPGAPDAFAYPNVTPGEFVDCGVNNGGFRLVLHQGTDDGGGQFGLARYRYATRLITQPSAAVSAGRLLLAFNNSTSPFFGDPTAGSEITLLYASDGGASWEPPFKVAASTAADPQHVHPAIALGAGGAKAFIGYYVQQADTKLRTDVATVNIGAQELQLARTARLSRKAFDLTPSNIPHPIASDPHLTTNYDRSVRACYNIGEYMAIVPGDEGESAFAAWGDNRNPWIGPADSAQPGSHAQADVFATSTGD
jgi:hypothetical protein